MSAVRVAPEAVCAAPAVTASRGCLAQTRPRQRSSKAQARQPALKLLSAGRRSSSRNAPAWPSSHVCRAVQDESGQAVETSTKPATSNGAKLNGLEQNGFNLPSKPSSLSTDVEPTSWRSPVVLAGGSVAAAAGAAVLVTLLNPNITTDVRSFFGDGFASSFLLIFFSEIGDKTFFIAMLLALRRSRAAVFAGTFGALALMSVLSVGFGRAFHFLDEALPFHTDVPLDDLAAIALLVVFGIRTLQTAYELPDNASSEGEKEEAAVVVAGVNNEGVLSLIATTFTLVFVAEWGDKSFLSTIALAAAESPLGVVTGAIAGHGLATALAVLGGSLISKYVSEKYLAYIGGSLFLAFAAGTLVELLLR
eukprot:jgi/Chlat1/3636/Chrsp238S03627